MSITLSLGEALLAGVGLVLATAAASGLVFCAITGGRLLRQAEQQHKDRADPDIVPAAAVPVAPVLAGDPEPVVSAAPDPGEEPAVEEELLPPAPTAGPWQGPLLADELPEPALAWLPEHAWHRNPTGPLPVVPPAAIWPAAPREIEVTTKLDDLVLTHRIEVSAP